MLLLDNNRKAINKFILKKDCSYERTINKIELKDKIISEIIKFIDSNEFGTTKDYKLKLKIIGFEDVDSFKTKN